MEGMIGEVRMFGSNFAPRTWAFCDGQLLAISQNTALFSILGTIYGGDGRTTFALPDLRGRTMIGPGNGPGLPTYRQGQRGGTETNTLNINQIPGHNHAVSNTKVLVSTGEPDEASPEDAYPGRLNNDTEGYSETGNVNMANNTIAGTVGNTGGGQSHNNMQPYATVHYIICLQGVFPSRS